MKSFLTSRRFVSVLALILAIVMCLSACGGTKETTSVDNGASDAPNATVEDTNSQAENESEKENASTPSKNQATSSKQQQQQQQQTVSGKVVWDKDYIKSMPASVKSKGVKILLWRDLHPTEQKLLDDFSKKSGCKVTKVITTEKEYSTKLISLITAKNAPDICVLDSTRFPSIVTKSMQPLDEKIFRLEDDCWNKMYMDAYKINGKYYSVAMPGAWNCEDTTFITYYQPKVLKECGVTNMPYDLYKEGKWNWETQFDIAAKVKNTNKGYIGISLHHFDMFMLSAGLDFADYDGKKFTNNIGSAKADSLLVKSWQAAAKLNENGLSYGWDIAKVRQGKVGLFTTIAYGLYNEGNFAFDEMPGGFEAINVVPVAGPKGKTAYTPSNPKTWGVPKGAKNIEGAAYFLRYWLDIKNCDMDSTFINKQSKEVFDIITNSKFKKRTRIGMGAVNYVTDKTYEQICYVLNQTTSANIATVLNSKKGSIEAGITKANRDLARLK